MAVWQPRSIAGNVWPTVPPPPANQLWTMYLELERTQWLSPSQIEEGQLAQLRTLLAHCAQHVPYYQEALRAAGVQPADIQTMADVRRLPLLHRQVLQEQGPRLHAAILPAGSRPTTIACTAGTVGRRVEIRQTNLVNLWWFAFNLRDLDWCGVDPAGSLAILRRIDADSERVLTGFRKPAWNDQFPLLFENGPAHVMTVRQDPRRQLDWLEQVQPDYLQSYRSNLEVLADLLAARGRRLQRLRLLLSLAETLTDEARSRIENAFGVPVRNTYSCAEAGYVASPCPQGHGLHVHAENVLLELLDKQGEPCPPGVTGRVLLTTLHNFFTPLIRYEVLDFAVLGDAPCQCGRGLPLLRFVWGKNQGAVAGSPCAVAGSPDPATGHDRRSPSPCKNLETFGHPEWHGQETVPRRGPQRSGTMFLPVRTIPGTTWPLVPSSELCQLWGLVLELERTQWLSSDEIIAGQLSQIRALLAHCKKNVPYYETVLADVEPDHIRSLADFRRVPILARSAYNEHFPRFQARSLPPGVVKTGEDESSGTSGVSVEVWQTNDVVRWWYALTLRDLLWSGIDPRGSLASLRVFGSAFEEIPGLAEGKTLPCWHKGLEPLLQTGPLFMMDIRQDPRRQLDWLHEMKPDYLLCHTSTLEFLAGLQLERGRSWNNLRAIQAIAESLTDEAKARIESAFGAPVKNLYSCTEAGYLASPCPEGHGLHVHAENVLLEVLDDDDRPCQPGETGRVVITALHNFLTPFVRYDIMDRATLGPEQCPCGRGLPLLVGVEGKLRPLLLLADGRRKPSAFLIDLLLLGDLSHQYQIIQKSVDHVVVRLVPNRCWNDEAARKLERQLREYLEGPVRVDIECVDRVQMTARGKVRGIVVEV